MDQQSSSSRLPPIQTLLPSSSYPVDDQVATAAASLLQIRGSPLSARPPTLQQRLLSFPDVQSSFAAYPPAFPKPFPSWQSQQQQQYRFIPQTKSEYQYREPSIVAGPSYLPQSISQPQHLQSRYATPQPLDSFGRKRKRSSLSETISRSHSVRTTLVNDKGKFVERQAMEDSGADIDVTGNCHEEADWEVRCICGLNVDDGFTIQCESCHVWQHAACFKIQPNAVPEVYLCEKCHPRQIDAYWANAMQSERFEAHQKTRSAEKKKRNRAGSTPQHGPEQENMHALYRARSLSTHSTVRSPFAPAPSVDSAFTLHGSFSASPGQREHLRGMTRNAYFDVQPAFSKVWRGASEDGESDMSPVTSSLPMLVPHNTTSDSDMSAPTPTTFLHPLPVRSSSCSLRALYPIARQSGLAQYTREATANEECINESSPQYDQRGIHNVHPMPSSLTLFLNEKGINDNSRLAGCRNQPNAVLRPIVCGKKLNMNSIDDPRSSLITSEVNLSDIKDGKPEVAFGVFALRDLKADEEIVLGWEWDDRYVVHELSELLKEGYGSGSENLKQSMGEALPDLLSSFTTCACGRSAHNCAVARMEKHINLERDRDERERAAVASLLQHRVSSLRDQPQQAEHATEAMQMDVSPQNVEPNLVSDAPRGSVEVDQSICMVHDSEEPHSTGESKVCDSAGVNTNAADKGRMNKRRGSTKHVHFPQSESESIRETRPASTNGAEEQRPKKKAKTASPQPSQETSTIVSAQHDFIASEETKQVAKEPLKELNTATPKMEVDKDYQGLDSNPLLTVTHLEQPLLSPSTALASLSIQCAMDKEKLVDAESPEIVPPTPSTSMSMLHSTSMSSPENYTVPLPNHSNPSQSSPKPEASSLDFSHQESERKIVSTVAPLLPSLVANTSSSSSSSPGQVDSSVVSKTPISLAVQDVPRSTPEQPKKATVRRRTLADWKSSKDKEREALKQQEREAKERETTKHEDLSKSKAEMGQFTGSQEQQSVEGTIEVVPSQSHDDVNGMLGQVAEIVAVTDTGNLESSTPVMTTSTLGANHIPTSNALTHPGSPVDVEMLDVKFSHSPVRRSSLLNEAVKDMEVVERDEIQPPTDHTFHINHRISQSLPLSEQIRSMSEDGEISSSSSLLRHPPPPATSQPRPRSRSTTPVLRSPSRESSRPPSRVSSGTASHPTAHSPTPRSPPRHPRSYRPPSPPSRSGPGYSSRPGHHTDNRYSSRPPPVGPRALRNGPPFSSSYHPRAYSRPPPPSGPPPPGRDRYSSQRPYDPDNERGWSNRRAGSSSRGGGFDDRGSRNSDRPVFER